MNSPQDDLLPTVLVTAVAGASVGGQLCKALLQPGSNVRVAVANATLQPLAVAPAECQRFLLPMARDPGYFAAVVQAAKEAGAAFVVTGSEVELEVLGARSAELLQHGLTLLANTSEVIATCMDKTRCMEALTNLGVPIPLTHTPADENDLFVPGGRYPIILKPETGGSGSAMTFLAQDEAEHRFVLNYMHKAGRQPIVQEYVGTIEDEFTVGVLHFPDRTLAGVVVIQRDIMGALSNKLSIANRTGREELGPVLGISSGITQGHCVRNDAVAATAIRIAESLGSRGPLNVQGRWNGSAFVPFEINPRFSGTTMMRALVGLNEPLTFLDWHLQRPRALPSHLKGGALYRSLVEHFWPDGSEIPARPPAP